jgi:hypothetical protein
VTDQQFWGIVALLDWSRVSREKIDDLPRADLVAVLEPAVERLSRPPNREILQFHEHLSWRLYTLDTREHALHFVPGERFRGYVDDGTPFSTDGFLDSRALAIAMGRREYERIQADPTKMPGGSFELFLSLPDSAYERKTGQPYEYEPGISTWAGSNKAGWVREPAQRGAAPDPARRTSRKR